MSAERVPQLIEAMQASFVIFTVICVASLVCSIVRYRDLRKI